MGETVKESSKKELIQKIDELREELNSVDERDLEKNIRKLEEEKNHLISVKNTILHLRGKNRLLSTYVSKNAEKLSVRSRRDSKEKTKEETLNKNPALLILMGISGIMVILFLCAWIQINGYRISFFELAQETDNLTYVLGTSESTQGIISLLWIMCI